MDYENRFKSIVDISFNEIRKISIERFCLYTQDKRNAIFKEIDRGKALLSSDNQLCAYMYRYGCMHKAKLDLALKSLPDDLFKKKIEIIDWGCGQGIATVCLLDYIIKEGNSIDYIERVRLVEPSLDALKRAKLHVTGYIQESNINTINKYIDDITENDIKTENDLVKLHLFSNILDVEQIDLKKLALLIDSSQQGDNYLLCISPQYPLSERVETFYRYFPSPNTFFNDSQINYIYDSHKSSCTYHIKVFEKNNESIPVREPVLPFDYYPPVQYHAGYILDAVKKGLNQLFTEEKKKEVDKLKGLYSHLSSFEVYSSTDLRTIDRTNITPEIAVLHNLIVRGLPTTASIIIEEAFVRAFNKSQKDISYGSISYKAEFNEDIIKNLFTALHLIDPRLRFDRNNYNTDQLESNFEKAFIFNELSNSENEYLIQLLEPQRELSTIVPQPFKKELTKQRVDFSLEIPYLYKSHTKEYEYTNIGTIIEIDGYDYHSSYIQRLQDQYRDNKAAAANWNSYHITSLSQVDLINKYLDKKNKDYYDYIAHIKYNWERDIKDKEHNIALQFSLTPFAVARLQKVIIEAIIAKCLDLSKKEWSILVNERDVPCAALALKDLEEWYNHLMKLKGKNDTFPKINLDIISTKEFIESPLHLIGNEDHLINISLGAKNKHYQIGYDLVIDISMLRRSGIENLSLTQFKAKNNAQFVIRSSHYKHSTRIVYTSDLIEYQPLVIKSNIGKYFEIESTKNILTYFLQNIFRKESFRPGQLPIIDRALRLKNVIGLLPTGGGKSLTYQLAAMLQPGITLVIDPLKSLMVDQYDGLQKNGIDYCTYVNSDIKINEKNYRLNQMQQSELQFVFLSPERLTMQSFRDILDEMYQSQIYFSYGIIDEVHCVSEWGHDFRTSYLHLGMNLLHFAKRKGELSLPLFGLTATASFDVLADVERELAGNGPKLDANTIVRYENTNRLELQYKIEKIDVDFQRKSNLKMFDINGKEIPISVYPLCINNEWDIKNNVSAAKQKRIQSFIPIISNKINELQETNSLEVIKEKFNSRQEKEEQIINTNLLNININEDFLAKQDKYDHAGIVFCPHRAGGLGVNNGKTFPGVKSSIESLTKDIGTFTGGDADNSTDNIPLYLDKVLAYDNDSMSNLKKFKDDELAIMVATKAFGMGIDKPNVRYTINVNYPSSLESFVQEAGRAGRDKKMALATILFCNTNLLHVIEIKQHKDEIILENLKRIKYCWFIQKDLDILLKEINADKEYVITESYNADYDIPMYFFNTAFPGEEKEKVIFNEFLNHIDNVDYVKEEDENPKTSIEASIFKEIDKHKEGDIFNIIVTMNNSLFTPSVILNSIKEALELPLNEDKDNFINNSVIKKDGSIYSSDIIKNKLQSQYHNPFEYSEREQIKNQAVKIEDLFNRKRDKMITDKAIYRMVCIGLIDDFTVNYKNNTYCLYIKKKPLRSYINALKEFYKRYYSTEKANEKVAALSTKNINEEIKQCLDELTKFVYENTVKKRKTAINRIKDFCLKGISPGKDWKELNEDLKDDIYYYFNSKYARDEYIASNDESYSLLKDTDDGKESSFDIVKKYMRITDENIDNSGTPVDNIKHLQGAVRLIRRSATDNPTLMLLNSFCLFYLGTNNNEVLEKELEESYNGFVLMYDDIKNQVSIETFMEYIDSFNNIIIYNGNAQNLNKANNFLSGAKDRILFLIHSSWLNNFSSNYTN